MKRSLRWITITGAAVVLLIASAVLATALGLTQTLFARPAADLVGSQWNLTEINGQAPIASPEPITIGFQADGQMGGNSGCNLYGGQYTAAGSTLALTEVFSTLRACADDTLNTQEVQVHQALAGVAQYHLQGDTLTLQDASGAALLVFERA